MRTYGFLLSRRWVTFGLVVVVLAGAPGRVAAEVTVTVPRPRRRRDGALLEAARQLRAELSGRSAEL